MVRHRIDVAHGFPVERVEVADGLRAFGRDLVGEVFDRCFLQHAARQLAEARRHANFFEERDLAVDAFLRFRLVIAEVFRHVPDFFSEMREAMGVVMIDVLRPCAPDGCEALAVRRVEFRAERVAELVAREILATAELREGSAKLRRHERDHVVRQRLA